MKDRLYIDKKLKEIEVLLDNKCIELKEQLDDFVKEENIKTYVRDLIYKYSFKHEYLRIPVMFYIKQLHTGDFQVTKFDITVPRPSIADISNIRSIFIKIAVLYKAQQITEQDYDYFKKQYYNAYGAYMRLVDKTVHPYSNILEDKVKNCLDAAGFKYKLKEASNCFSYSRWFLIDKKNLDHVYDPFFNEAINKYINRPNSIF